LEAEDIASLFAPGYGGSQVVDQYTVSNIASSHALCVAQECDVLHPCRDRRYVYSARHAASEGGSPMGARTDEQRAYVETLLNRLRRLYVEREPMPEGENALSFEMLQRLCYHISTEGYGE
jgi:hypothetical protein